MNSSEFRSLTRRVPSSVLTMVRALRSTEERDKSTGRGSDKASDKYAMGSVIADVPSNKTGLHKGIFEVYPRRDLIRTNDS